MPSPEQTEKIKSRIDIISIPRYIIEGLTRQRHGTETVARRPWEVKRCNSGRKEKKVCDEATFRRVQGTHGRAHAAATARRQAQKRLDGRRIERK